MPCHTKKAPRVSVFFLTVVFDLTMAVQVGILAACVTFIWRMAQLTRAEPLVPPERLDVKAQ